MSFKHKKPFFSRSDFSYQKYKNYLLSDAWAMRKDQLFSVVGRNCEMCGSGNHIQVHHLTYERLYDERAGDLVVVCSECHEIMDKDRKENTTQNQFAGWMYRGRNHWRKEIPFIEIVKIFAKEVHHVKENEISKIFGISVEKLRGKTK